MQILPKALSFLLVLVFSSPAVADLSVRRLQSLGATRILASASPDPARERQEVLVRVDSEAVARRQGLVPVTTHWATFRGRRAALPELVARPGIRSIHWAPLRFFQLDEVGESTEAVVAREDFGVDGDGVVIGIVDTGVDVAHPAFRTADGSTRIRWLLSYDQPPRGVHPAVEEEMGCVANDDCAVFDAEDIDALLETPGDNDLPRDTIGHGTHITSIAAGSDPDYPGIAPGAELVLVQGAGATGGISDARIVEGVRFIFDRATEMAAPAVANLSLGSGFGAHDGTSLLETTLQGLASGPGRIIVVASGNDGALYQTSLDYPEPVGVHAEVTVPSGSEVRVPLIMPETTSNGESSVFVWLSFAPGDDIQVALSAGGGASSRPVAPGASGYGSARELGRAGDYEFLIANGVDPGLEAGIEENNAVFALVGSWPSREEFELVLTGQGTARLWVESAGAIGPGVDSPGVLLPRARGGGTVTIPASAPGLVAVGASVNRQTWTDYTGTEVEVPLGRTGVRAYFSGSGPNQLGGLRPDVMAPGGNIIAAMADEADPRGDEMSVSQFASFGACEDVETECFVVDDQHAVSSGTSMAAPVVSGAVALLLGRQPDLTMSQVQDLLRAGSAKLSSSEAAGRSGTGSLDVEATLLAQDLAASDATRLPGQESRVAIADIFLIPDPDLALQGYVVLRDEDNQPAGGFDPQRLSLKVDGPADVELMRLASGLAEFTLAGREGTAEQNVTVEVFFDDQLIAEKTLPVFVDAANARGGLELMGGACRWEIRAPAQSSGVVAVSICLLILMRRRRRGWGAG